MTKIELAKELRDARFELAIMLNAAYRGVRQARQAGIVNTTSVITLWCASGQVDRLSGIGRSAVRHLAARMAMMDRSTIRGVSQ